MGLIDRLREAVGGSGREADEEGAYVCIRCGATFDRPRSSCSACGGEFVAKRNPDDSEAE